MLFTAEILIPKKTTQAAPVIETLLIAHGVITWVSVFFPPGCCRLAHIAILHRDHQVWPSTENMTLAGDTFPIEWIDYYEVYQPPYILKIRGWNEDDSYPHQVTVRVAILPRKAVAAANIADAFKGAVAALLPRRT